MCEFRVDLKLGNKLVDLLVMLLMDDEATCRGILQYLLRQFCGLHLRLDNLQGDNVSRGLAAIVSFGAMADGETALSERRTGRIVDAGGLGDNWRRRLSVDGRHCRCRWPSMLHKSCAGLRWAMFKDEWIGFVVNSSVAR